MGFSDYDGSSKNFPPPLCCDDDDLEDDDKIGVPNSMIYLNADIIMGGLGMLVRFNTNKVVLGPILYEVL